MKKIALMISLGLVCLQSQAALVSSGKIVANGAEVAYATDTDTNYQWLSLNGTLGMSYESVFAATQTGGIFSGFTLASTAQVRQLFNNVGANVWYSSGMGGYSDGCRDWTCHDWYSTLVAGITSDVAEFSGVHHIAGEQWGYTRAMGSYHFQMSGSQRDSEGDPMHGAFLFRDLSVSPVPEPATYGMLGAGLALVGMRLRRKRMY